MFGGPDVNYSGAAFKGIVSNLVIRGDCRPLLSHLGSVTSPIPELYSLAVMVMDIFFHLHHQSPSYLQIFPDLEK